jgi:divalent metal cation (Fe/Co/Zn/Cd) transporter
MAAMHQSASPTDQVARLHPVRSIDREQLVDNVPSVQSRAEGRPDVAAATFRSVVVSFAVNSVQTVALAITAWVTGAVALRAQTAANAADTAVEVFLLIGVLSSARPPDETHPLGYGREGFFWSLFAALGIFVGGSGLALNGAIHAALSPSPIESYTTAYIVLATTIAMDAFALVIALRPLREEASARGVSLRTHLHRSTDPASVTVAVGGGCAVAGGIIAVLGLLLSEQMEALRRTRWRAR